VIYAGTNGLGYLDERERINALTAQGKTVKILCVGKKGYDQLRRQFEKQIIELIDLRSVRQIGFVNADEIGRKIIALFESGSSTSARCSSRASVR
jgi:F-type H+-transporting ATPase subunit gamma